MGVSGQVGVFFNGFASLCSKPIENNYSPYITAIGFSNYWETSDNIFFSIPSFLWSYETQRFGKLVILGFLHHSNQWTSHYDFGDFDRHFSALALQ